MRIGWKLPSSDQQIASVRFRGLTPIATLKARGLDIELFNDHRASQYDVVIISKIYDQKHQQLTKQLRANNQRVIFDLSDNHFYNPRGLKQYQDAAANLDRMIGLVDVVSTCSEFLAGVIRSRPVTTSPVVVVEDAVEDLDVVRGRARTNPSERLRISWFGSHGSPNSESGLADLLRLNRHLEDIELPKDSLLTVMSNNPAAYHKVAGRLRLASRYIQWDQEKFCDLLSSTDVVVLPITATDFANSKSSNRIATPLWYGIPVIADGIPAYEAFGKFAYVNNWADGFLKIAACHEDAASRTKLGTAFVRSNFNNETIGSQWQKAIERALHGPRNETADEKSTKSKTASTKPKITPGSSAAAQAPYLQSPSQIASLKSLPQRSRLLSIPFERLVSKLKIEHQLFNSPDQPRPKAICYVVDTGKTEPSRLLKTLKSVSLQSHATYRTIFIASDTDQSALSRMMIETDCSQDWSICADTERLKCALSDDEMCVFLRAGDVLDASLGSICSVYAQKASFVAFSYATLSGDKCERVVHLLNQDSLTHDHAPIIGNAFAVSSFLVRAYPGDLVREMKVNNFHLFQIWLRRNPDLAGVSHPEILLFKDEKEEPRRLNWFSDYQDAYEVLLATDKNFHLVAHRASDPAPFHMVPNTRPKGVSVLIPFRDSTELTLAAVRSIVEQADDFPVEVLLINNNSCAASMNALSVGLEGLPDFEIRVIDYPFPFNHSAQMNLGAREARHDVLVFMNNDCKIESPSVFRELAAWAISDGVGTVGTRIINPETSHASLGIIKRLAVGSFFDSPVEEMTQPPELQTFTRRVFGNTFAFAAISRERFLQLGGLDSLHFPIGYNDVDFAMRCSNAGLRSLCLGHLVVSHAPGKSRSKTDETTQKVCLKTLHKATLAYSQEDYLIDSSFKDRPLFYT